MVSGMDYILARLDVRAHHLWDATFAQISETCPQCKNDKMSFHTAQLRSADEGQTIFYTCLKCKYVTPCRVYVHWAFHILTSGLVVRVGDVCTYWWSRCNRGWTTSIVAYASVSLTSQFLCLYSVVLFS